MCACVCVRGEGRGLTLASFVSFIHLSVPTALFPKKKERNSFLPPVAADVGNLVFSISCL